MKIKIEKDRIRWQSENAKESEALRAIQDLVFFGTGVDEEIANDHGCNSRGLNYCTTPLPMTVAESQTAVVCGNGNN